MYVEITTILFDYNGVITEIKKDKIKILIFIVVKFKKFAIYLLI